MQALDQDFPPEGSEDCTLDPFFHGKLMVKQYRTGYRFSIDSVLLAGFIEPNGGLRAADLGAGCGIISLLLAHTHPDMKIYAVEIQKELVGIAVGNVQKNNMELRIEMVQEDIKTLNLKKLGGPVDLVVCNPPYRKVESGKINHNHQKAAARHEIHATLEDFIKASRRVLKVSGRLFMIYPAERSVDLICGMRESGLEPKRIQWVHSRLNSPAKLIMVEAIKGGGPEVRVQKPLAIYGEDGSYTPELQKMMNG
ncbi:MAG: tRNA1(Val) (adenine(37)-N6)-methyltransferase [Proteobacteria bacterium]|nr:tRNA1(Val) (adenine(37)-N6)-methyltransferase [Pseudomonadota bacterium]